LKIIEQNVTTLSVSSCESRPDSDLTNVLDSAAEQINAQLPSMLDEVSRLESASVDGTALVYLIEIIDLASSEIDADELRETLRPGILQHSCGPPNPQPIIQQGGTFTYQYEGNDQVTIAKISVSLDDCG